MPSIDYFFFSNIHGNMPLGETSVIDWWLCSAATGHFTWVDVDRPRMDPLVLDLKVCGSSEQKRMHRRRGFTTRVSYIHIFYHSLHHKFTYFIHCIHYKCNPNLLNSYKFTVYIKGKKQSSIQYRTKQVGRWHFLYEPLKAFSHFSSLQQTFSRI